MLMTARKHETELYNGPLLRKIFLFALPIMAMNVLQLMFSAIGMIVIGNYEGETALAAVGATGSIINLIINLFMGLAVGTSVVVAQDYGANQPAAVSRSVHTSIAVSIIAGLIVMAIGMLFSKPLLIMMGTPDNIIDLSALYLKIYFLGIPASMVFNFGAAILRAVGDSRRPMYFLLVAGVMDMASSLFFVAVLRWSVAGVACATVISQYTSLVLIMICLCRSHGVIRFDPRQMRIDPEKLKRIVKIGLLAGMQGLLFSISNVLIQSAVNSFGATMMAASTVSGNVESFIGTTMNAYYNAAVTFTGQNMGAKKFDRIDTVAKVCTVLIFSTWIVLGSATVFFGKSLLGLYTNEAEVIQLGMMRMKVMMVAYFTCGIMNVYPGLTRGMGYSIPPMLCTLVGNCLMRIVWLATVFTWYPTEVMLFACYPVTWALAGIGQIFSFLYARKQVRKRAALEEVSPSPA